jgi:uncharacterized protein (TIGR02246 family)
MGVQQEFEELGRRFVEALRSGDLEGLMDFFTEDAVVLSGGEPVAQGRSEISDLIASWIESHPTRGDYTTLACKCDGDMGWWVGEYSGDFKNEDGYNESEKGKFLDVLYRQTDGSWKLQAVCVCPHTPMPEYLDPDSFD